MFVTRLKLSVGIALLFASAWLGLGQAQTSADLKIEPKVLTDLKQDGKTTFFVVLSEQVNLNQATSITDWKTRGEVVVRSLKGVAERTQRPILAFLANTNVEIVSFWIVNTIKVTTGDEQLIHWLAAMPFVFYRITNGLQSARACMA
jgi:phosphoserine phosphatase